VAQVIVRDLDDGVVAALKRRAALHGQSLEQELRDILTAAALPERPTSACRSLNASAP
jgi:plasmid stability protein